MTLRIYTASKLYMADAWKELRYQLTDVQITASWIDIPEIQKLDESGNLKIIEKAWERNIADVLKADVTLVYAGPDDILVGGLIEAGVALGAGKTVICVGSSKSFGTWVHHPSVYKEKSIIDAVELARTLFG